MNEKYTVSCPMFGLLGIAFIVLKLCGVVSWSWWWVLAPFWFPLAAVLGVLFGILLVTSIIGILFSNSKK